MALSARHGRARPRHAFAPHLRRARCRCSSASVVMPCRSLRRRARPRRGLRRRLARYRDHAHHGPHRRLSEPRAGDPDRRHPADPSLEKTIVAVAVVYAAALCAPGRAPRRCRKWARTMSRRRRCAGVGPLRLMLRTVLPNCLAPLIVQAALGVSDAILDAAALGFLGLGAQPPTPEWGSHGGRRARIHPLRPWIVTLARPRDPRHRARVQPVRRRTSRCARSEAEAELAHGRSSTSATSPSLRHPLAAPSRAVDGFDLTIDRDEVLASSANPARANPSPCSR